MSRNARRSLATRTDPHRRRRGNASVAALLVLTLIMGVAGAQFAVQQTSIRQSRFFSVQSDLHKDAESALARAIHELNYGIGAQPGNIGTTAWNSTLDVGEDGVAQTGDRGEGDGLPTPGEPGLSPVTYGSTGDGVSVLTSVFDLGGGVRRVVATAFNQEGSATVEKQLLSQVVKIPRVSSIIVSPDVALDLKGNSFLIDGRDHDKDGNLIAGAEKKYGLAVPRGSTPGKNLLKLFSQIPTRAYSQILGKGSPSVGEVEAVDLKSLTDGMKSVARTLLSAGTMTNFTLGTPDSPQTSYVEGNLHLSGKGTGAGVIVVDGDLRITGQFQFVGLVIVRGDLVLSGGGAKVHTIGSLVVEKSLTAVDKDGELTISGNADVLFSSQGLDVVDSAVSNTTSYKPVYYHEGY